MEDQQLFVISPDGKGEVTLLDTDSFKSNASVFHHVSTVPTNTFPLSLVSGNFTGGILVEQGEYSITIPSAGQQVQVPQTQPQQQVVYTTQQAVVQPRVVYSPQPQQVYQVAPAHSQQVVFAGGTPVQQQVQVPIVPQQQQQVLIQQQHRQIASQQLLQTQQQQQPQQQQQQQQPQQQQPPQQQQQQQQQQVQQHIFITPQGQRLRTQYVATQPQQQVGQKSYHIQLQPHQVQHPHLQIQQPQQQQPQPQQQIAVQAPGQITQQIAQPQQQLSQPQIPVLQAGQQPQANTIAFYEEKVTDDKGVVHIMRTPVSMTSGVRRTVTPGVAQQPVTQSAVSSQGIQPVTPVIGGIRATTPLNTVGQGPRLQRSTPIHRPPNPAIQGQEQQQPSYQEAYIKQIENKMPVQQKAMGRTKNTKPSAQQRRYISQQLGNVTQQQLQGKQVVGVQHGRTIITSPALVSASVSGTETLQQQADQNSSPSKKLSLTEYRSRQRVSQDLKQQQQQTTTIVAQTPPRAGEEVRMVPVSVNANNRQQYCFLQQSDGKKYLCPVEMKTTLGGTPTATSATITNSKPGQLTAGNNSVVIVKQEVEGTRSSTSPVQASSSVLTSPSPSPSPSKIVTTGVTTSTPPIQEQTIHSTATTEQPEKDPNDKPRYITGRAALCSNCGILSEDLNRCQRCNFRFPASIRTMSSTNAVSSTKNNSTESQGIGRGITLSAHINRQEFYGKTGGGLKKGADKRATASPAQKPKGRCRGRGKTYEEPEIVSLSSDEDEDKKPSSSAGVGGVGSTDGTPQSRLHALGPPDPISHKEPIITEDMENFEDAVEQQEVVGAVTGGGLPELQNLSDGTLKGPYTSIHCRSVRIGSYKVMPRDRVLIVPQGIKLKVPSIADSSIIVTVDIPVQSIVKVLAHFGKSLPVFFLYLKPSVGETVRKTLKMTDKNSYYYDPCSYDEAHKRITILPERMSDETKVLVKDILNMGGSTSNGKLEELVLKEANEILIRSSPTEVQSLVRKPAGSSPSETKTIIIYPPPPQKGGISITTDDYSCLEDEQFLNDVIIDFYLKWLLQSKLSEIHRLRTHVFSTFFYKRLTSKPKKTHRPHAIEDDPKLSAAEKRHSRVKSWTKNVDIFEKDFIIIPINEHAHWFLAIICYPGLSGPIRASDGQPISRASTERPRKRRSTRPRNRIEQIPIIDDGEWSDRDEAEGEEDELDEDDEEDDSPPSKKSKVEGAEPSEDNDQSNGDNPTTPPSVRQPCILIFDSLSGANRVRIVATLRDYLTVEHRKRKDSEKPFNRDTMKGACPRVPQQMNYSDCGIYTLQFAESFFEHPLKDYTFPIRTLGEWFPHEVVRGKREAIARLIKTLMEEHNPNHESIVLPEIMFCSDDRKDAGTNEAQGSSVSSSENKLGQLNQEEEEIPFLERNSEEVKGGSSDAGKEPSVESSGKDCSEGPASSKMSTDEDKPGSHFLKISPIKDEKTGQNVNIVPGSTIKVIQNTPMSEKSSETLRKSLLSVNRMNSPGTGLVQSKNISPLKGSVTTLQEKLTTQVNSVRRDSLLYDSDESIFPSNEKKKVILKSNVNNVSGLNLLQSNYADDQFEESAGEISHVVSRIDSNIGARTLTSTTSAMKVEKVVFKSEKNGVNEQVMNQVKSIRNNSSASSLENKTKLMNGAFENISRGNQLVQMVPSAQVLSAATVGVGENSKNPQSRMQITSNVSSQKQNMSGVKGSSYSFQSLGAKSSLSAAMQPISHSISTSQSQRIIEPSLPVSSTSSGMDTDSGVKTVETLGGTSIIDEDTEEVLFIMPVPSSTSNQCKSTRKVSYMGPEIKHRVLMDEERALSSPQMARLSATPIQDAETRTVRRMAGGPVSPPRSGSSSPTFSGSPTVFRFNSERVTSSGRTIAPPKRYLDDNEEVFQKKRRDKPVPGKTRIVR